ncbi:rho-related GTP-binding -like isoform X1 [Labeo rohita]|uniref:Rho-related GTP-binding-like isoform X1 n=1 Tax=Labeo rohita TaxID=84645 RepID=A0A498LM00_LABRO|nr:rho-related GTP-binding -like isoform X1 [Labeo rohita]
MPSQDEAEAVNEDDSPPPVPPRAAPQQNSPASAAVPERRVKCVLVGDGADEFERLRPLCYRDADVFLLCYSVVLPSSFRSVTDRWAPEVHRLCPGVPIILVGTQCDLREDVQVLIRLADSQEKPVSGDDARLCARSIGAVTFAECSALTQKNLKEVFDGTILASMQHAEEAAWPRRHTLREKTPDKIKQLSETWWRKLSCIQSFDLQ